jgi:hypothetical protein
LRHAALREGIRRWNCNECKSNWRQAGMLRDALGGLDDGVDHDRTLGLRA